MAGTSSSGVVPSPTCPWLNQSASRPIGQLPISPPPSPPSQLSSDEVFPVRLHHGLNIEVQGQPATAAWCIKGGGLGVDGQILARIIADGQTLTLIGDTPCVDEQHKGLVRGEIRVTVQRAGVTAVISE